MENPVPLSRRIAILAGVFLFILLSGVISMHVIGGTTGSLTKDFYLVLTLFGLEGEWVFEGPDNPYLKALVFAAPLFTILGIIEIFTRRALTLILQFWSLFWSSNHVIILGLDNDSILLIEALRRGRRPRRVAVIDKAPSSLLAMRCRKLGVPVVEGDPSDRTALAKAHLTKAAIAVSFVRDIADEINVVFAADKLLRKLGRKPVDLWLSIDEAEFGRRLGEYLKFAGLSDLVHPRFFNLNEVAARRLVRLFPPDVYADALGQDRLHLAVYGFGNFSFEVVDEYLLQTTSSFAKRPKVTILSRDPEKSKARLMAFCPEIASVADISFTQLDVYSTGIANQDYAKIPEDVTAHLVCYRNEETAAAVALSLRGLLLSPPAGTPGAVKRRLNAPIFVRLSRKRGIAQLLRSHIIDPALANSAKQKRGDLPDGIFAFGIKDDYLSIDQDNPMVPTVIDNARERAAKYIHFTYLADRGEMTETFEDIAEASDEVTRDWEALGPQYRESCRQVADHIWAKARLIRHRLLPRAGNPDVATNLSPDEKQRIAVSEHNRWMTERLLGGWTHHKIRVDEAKRHNLLRPWSDLSKHEATLDLKLADKISAAAAQAGLVLKRELVIGVVGHRFAPGRPFNEAYVKAEMKRAVARVLEENPDRAPVIYTHLADGADTIAAEVALEMKIPFVVPLPLPFETYRRDFEEGITDGVEKFLDLISLADRYFEIPLRFGGLVELAKAGKKGGASEAREQQYALGGAFIVERSDVMIAVWDGKPARGTGGTADIVAWCKKGEVPKAYRTPDLFNRHTPIKPAVVIRPTP